MSEFFNDDQDEFRDNPVTLQDGKWTETPAAIPPPSVRQPRQAAPQPIPAPIAAPQQTYTDETYEQQLVNEYSDDEEDYSAVLTDASLRLEQGQLWQMIMNNNIFEDIKADPKAVKAVQKSIRKFAKEQMEIMLGMKPLIQETPRVATDGPSPFNSLEVQLLKDLAHKMSQGKTAAPEAEKIATGLKTISGSTKSMQTAKPLQAKPAAPIQRPAAPTKPVASAIVAPQESAFKPLEKDPTQMTAQELKEYNAAAAERQRNRKAARPKDALPMPTYEQEEMLANQKAYAASNQVNYIMSLMAKK